MVLRATHASCLDTSLSPTNACTLVSRLYKYGADSNLPAFRAQITLLLRTTARDGMCASLLVALHTQLHNYQVNRSDCAQPPKYVIFRSCPAQKRKETSAG